jgi:phasin
MVVKPWQPAIRRAGRTIMSNETKIPFEVPAEMIAMAEKSFEQAKSAFDQFLNAANTTITNIHEQNRAAQAGALGVTGKIMGFAEQNVANAFAYAEKLVHVRDPQALMQLHNEYVQSQMRALSEQAKAVAEAAGKVATDATRPKT